MTGRTRINSAIFSSLVVAGLLLGCSAGGGGDEGSGSSFSDEGSDSDSSSQSSSTAREAFCGTDDPDSTTLSRLSAGFETFLLARRSSTAVESALARAQEVQIPVIFHVISKGPALEDGEVPDSQLAAQVDVLNREFAGSGDSVSTPFRFVLAGIDRVQKPEWHVMAPGSQAELDAKQELHSGDSRTLNVYIVKTEGGILGYTLLPVFVPLLQAFDGIVMNFETLPGGTFERYNTGNVLVHETGHWLGLLHTFSGECEGAFGDLVEDTPSERIPGKGDACPVSRDSCPELEGADPVHNHMTYTIDSCRTSFTQGQLDFMLFNGLAFRGLDLL